MSEQFDYKILVQYMSAIALALFYLIYLPWTYLSGAVLANPALTWIYYFTLVLGLMFPLYYAIGKESMAWICLGLSMILNAAIWMAVPYGLTDMVPAILVLIVGLLFFLGPFIEGKVGNWDLIKNVLHFLKGLLLVLAIGFFANFNIDAMIGATSANHIMPQFIFLGGGIMIAFAVCLMMYGLFNIFKMFLPEKIGMWFGDLAKIFYMLMAMVFLIGILFNSTSYISPMFGLPLDPWSSLPFASGSITFFAGLYNLGYSNLGAILFIILVLYVMGKIAKKFE